MYMYYKQLSGKKWNVCYTKITEKKQQRNEFSLLSTPKCQTHGKICPNSLNKGKFKTKHISIILEEVFCGNYRYTLNFDLLDVRYVSDCPPTSKERRQLTFLPDTNEVFSAVSLCKQIYWKMSLIHVFHLYEFFIAC